MINASDIWNPRPENESTDVTIGPHHLTTVDPALGTIIASCCTHH